MEFGGGIGGLKVEVSRACSTVRVEDVVHKSSEDEHGCTAAVAAGSPCAVGTAEHCGAVSDRLLANKEGDIERRGILGRERIRVAA